MVAAGEEAVLFAVVQRNVRQREVMIALDAEAGCKAAAIEVAALDEEIQVIEILAVLVVNDEILILRAAVVGQQEFHLGHGAQARTLVHQNRAEVADFQR